MSAHDRRTALALAVAGAEGAGWRVAAGNFFFINDQDSGEIVVDGDQDSTVATSHQLALPFPPPWVLLPKTFLVVDAEMVDVAAYDRFCCPLGAVALCAGKSGLVGELIAGELGVSDEWICAFAFGFDAADFFPDEPEATSPSVLREPAAYELGKRFREAVSP